MGHWMSNEEDLDVQFKTTSLRGVEFTLEVRRYPDQTACAYVTAVDTRTQDRAEVHVGTDHRYGVD